MDMQTPTIPKIDMTARGLTPDEVARSRKEYGLSLIHISALSFGRQIRRPLFVQIDFHLHIILYAVRREIIPRNPIYNLYGFIIVYFPHKIQWFLYHSIFPGETEKSPETGHNFRFRGSVGKILHHRYICIG